jgi:hypothetical protein
MPPEQPFDSSGGSGVLQDNACPMVAQPTQGCHQDVLDD